jgi:hypothetical protein
LATSACVDTLVIASHVDAGSFYVQMEYTLPIDDLTSASDAYREAQLETVALASQCFEKYVALKPKKKNIFFCESDLGSGSFHVKNYSLKSSIICKDGGSFRISSVVGFPLK